MGEVIAGLAAGIVSKDLVGACTALPKVRAVPLGVAGFHEDGRVAVITAPWLDACGGDMTYRVYEATLPWLHHEDETTFAPVDQSRTGGSTGPAEPAVAEWLARRLKRGFAAPPEVARAACQYEAWVSPVPRLTILGEPLDRWMLLVGRGRRTLPVRLVGPSNKRAWDLDPITLRPGVHCEADDAKTKRACAKEVAGEVLQVALTPNRRSLVVTVAVGTGERCAPARLVHQVFRLPDGVRSILPKPHLSLH